MSEKVETEQPRKHNVTDTKEEELKNAPEYTPEQLEAVKEIMNCNNDHYKILGVNKFASNSQIKMAYKRLALKIHPDKNKHPEAAEAFKKIGNAIAILSDMVKRREYDLSCPEDESETQEYNTSQESDTDATDENDEDFNWSFSDGFNEYNTFWENDGGEADEDDEGFNMFFPEGPNGVFWFAGKLS